MPKSYENILNDVKKVIANSTSLLDELTDKSEASLLKTAIEVEKQIENVLDARLTELETGKLERQRTFRLMSTEGNYFLSEVIARACGVVLDEEWNDGGKEWLKAYITKAFEESAKSVVEVATEGDISAGYVFNETDATILETALTKGYGEQFGGCGRITAISEETENSIRDVIVKAIRERKTITELQKMLITESGLTSLTVSKSGSPYTLSLKDRAKLVARNEMGQIIQISAENKSREIFQDDPYWYYGSVYEPKRMSQWCKKRFGRIAKVSQWNDPNWVQAQFGDKRTGTGHIHINCRQTGHAVSKDWFPEDDWKQVEVGKHILIGKDLTSLQGDEEAEIVPSKVLS